MTRSRSRRIARLATVLAVATIGASLADAARGDTGIDAKMYTAASCQQGGTSQAFWYYHGRVINTSTSTSVADCPIVTDTAAGLGGNQKAEVFVIDRHYSGDFSCTIHSYNPRASTPQYHWTNRRSSGSSNNVQVLTYKISSAWVWGPALLGCAIPGVYSGNRSELVSYMTWEYESDFYDD